MHETKGLDNTPKKIVTLAEVYKRQSLRNFIKIIFC